MQFNTVSEVEMFTLYSFPQDYGKTLKEAGFADVSAQDRTEQFTAILKEELDRFTKEKDSFLQVQCSVL